MKATKRILAMTLALVMLCSTMAACGKNPAAADSWDGTPQYGGHMNVKTMGFAQLDPMKNASTWRYMCMTAVVEPFLTRDSENNIQPCVCDYELNEDQTELKLWPREGYVFSRGYGQVEMDDVVASFNRGILYSGAKNNVLPNVISQEVVMDEELGHEVFLIKFNYSEKNMYYIASMKTWWPVMPKEICEKYSDSYIEDQVEDCVGTGPYIVTQFASKNYCVIEKRDDYVPYDQGDLTGPAATKYGYLDSIAFINYDNDAPAASASLAGQLDLNEVIPAEYYDAAEAAGIVLSKLPSDQRCVIKFNTYGTNNLVAKYPSLRKAVMAALDYETYGGYITDESLVMDGDSIMLSDLYDQTAKFKNADYYGAYNQAVVDKYMAQAREEGYNGEKLQIPFGSNRTDIITMTAASMEKAGIPYEIVGNEQAVHSEFIGNPENNWDFYYTWQITYPTPGAITDSFMATFNSERVAEIRSEMVTLNPTSDEYLALWDEWTDIWVEECQMGYIGAIDWWWWHPATLHVNDGGDDPNDGNYFRFVYNCYWEDPQNHSDGYVAG